MWDCDTLSLGARKNGKRKCRPRDRDIGTAGKFKIDDGEVNAFFPAGGFSDYSEMFTEG